MNGLHVEQFDCFGAPCVVEIRGTGPHGSARRAAAWAKHQLLEWHVQFSRFLASSELSVLNADRRTTVPATPLMVDLAEAIVAAGRRTDGVVDGTVIPALERSGYTRNRTPASGPVGGVAGNPRRRPDLSSASGDPRRPWDTILVDRSAGTITRPGGIHLDSGGLLKGLAADGLVESLSAYEAVYIDCGGDLAIGGTASPARPIDVHHPFDGSVIHTFTVGTGGMATSGTSRRRWTGVDGEEAHHLIDPSTGRPAFTGLEQVTALAPTALEAEVLAKWALLGGPPAARVRLTHGGVIVDQLGDVTIVAPPAAGDDAASAATTAAARRRPGRATS